jgi:8-oxo-dGTP diphosphatase
MNKRDYPERPFVGVGTVIVGPDGVVLIRRSKPPRKGSWSLPGGIQELGETVEQCARREAFEETGLHVSLIGLIDAIDSIQTDDNGKVLYHYTLLDYIAMVDSGALAPGSDADDAQWFTRAQISNMGLWSETKRVIDLAYEIYDALNVP